MCVGGHSILMQLNYSFIFFLWQEASHPDLVVKAIHDTNGKLIFSALKFYHLTVII